MKLTFSLFEESVTEFEDALNPDKIEGNNSFTPIDLTNVDFDGIAYIQNDMCKRPKWFDFFEPYLDTDSNLDIFNTYNSLIVLVRVEKRIFAITQGYGYVGLNREKCQRRFGLRTALNAIDAEKIRAFDVHNIDVKGRQKRTVMNAASVLQDFDIDYNQDVIQAVTGIVRDKEVGERIQGADALILNAKRIQFPEIGEKCRKLLETYNRTDYRENFEFIDHLHEVKSKPLKERLDALLIDALTKRSDEKLLLTYPQLARWDDIDEFRIWIVGRKKDAISMCDITVEALYEWLDALLDEGEDTDPRRIKVSPLDDGGQSLDGSMPLYDYVCYETEDDGKCYVLSMGQWFEVSADYLNNIDEELAEVVVPIELGLPSVSIADYTKEEKYNMEAAEAIGGVCLDKRNITLPHYSPIEACDILSPSGHFIHVKRWNSSATLSHLLSQGFVSAKLLLESSEYRAEVIKKVGKAKKPPNFPLHFSENEVVHKAIPCVYAIIIAENRDVPDSLPLFSKINLLYRLKSLIALGFSAKVCKIPLLDA